MTETCRRCDGSGHTTKAEKDNIFKAKTKTCGNCQGSGREPSPSKGRRYIPPKDEDNLTLEEQTRAFLRAHGE